VCIKLKSVDAATGEVSAASPPANGVAPIISDKTFPYLDEIS
jgi:hypothetical protein